MMQADDSDSVFWYLKVVLSTVFFVVVAGREYMLETRVSY